VIYSPSAGLHWTPFDFGAIRSRVKASEAHGRRGSLASYEQTVATALEESEDAFSGYTRNAQRGERLLATATRTQEAAQLARLRFDSGVTDFLIVLDAEREVLNNPQPTGTGADRHGDGTGQRLLSAGRLGCAGCETTALPSNSSQCAARVVPRPAGYILNLAFGALDLLRLRNSCIVHVFALFPLLLSPFAVRGQAEIKLLGKVRQTSQAVSSDPARRNQFSMFAAKFLPSGRHTKSGKELNSSEDDYWSPALPAFADVFTPPHCELRQASNLLASW
jgi:hypothetical protein